MAVMNKTPLGTICGCRWKHGVFVGIYGGLNVVSFDYDETDGLVLLVNDDAVDELGVKVRHTDMDWNEKE